MSSKPTMFYRYLGSTGVMVSSLCLGTMTFGQFEEDTRPGQTNEEESHALLDAFVAAGGNFIDTADIYQTGGSEQYIGSWLAKHPELRKDLIIATKLCSPMRKNVNCLGLSRHHIMEAVDASLERLRTNYIDLYQTHCWDNMTNIEETLHALNDLVRSGKVRYIGVSNVSGWQLQKIVDLNKKFNYPQIVSLQAQYSLLCRETEWELMKVCELEGISLLPWSPLKGGMLTGKFTRGAVPTDPSSSRVAWVESNKAKANLAQPSYSQYADNDQYWALIDAMKDIAQRHNGTVAQVAIAWVLKQPTVSSVVIGARTPKQFEDNVKSTQLALTKEELMVLNEKSRVPLPYPYELLERVGMVRGSFVPIA